jgi:hypothetical protein
MSGDHGVSSRYEESGHRSYPEYGSPCLHGTGSRRGVQWLPSGDSLSLARRRQSLCVDLIGPWCARLPLRPVKSLSGTEMVSSGSRSFRSSGEPSTRQFHLRNSHAHPSKVDLLLPKGSSKPQQAWRLTQRLQQPRTHRALRRRVCCTRAPAPSPRATARGDARPPIAFRVLRARFQPPLHFRAPAVT